MLVQFFPGAWGEYEWECVEYSMRFMYLAYGTHPYNGNGNQVYANYPGTSGTVLQRVPNGTAGQAPQPGDVLSDGATDPNGGHTAVVSASSVDGNGNGQVTVVEENAASSGQETLSVSHWYVNYYKPVIGWLHNPNSSPPPPPPTGQNILQNSDFSSNSAANWNFTPGMNEAVYPNGGPPGSVGMPGGVNFLEMNVPGNGYSTWQDISSYALPQGTPFLAGVWVRSPTGTPFSLDLALWEMNGAEPNVNDNVSYTTSGSGWTFLMVYHNIQAADRTAVRLQVYLNTPSVNIDIGNAFLMVPSAVSALYSAQCTVVTAPPGQMAAGQQASAETDCLNTGQLPWYSTNNTPPGSDPVALGTTNPQNRGSAFYVSGAPGWLNAGRITMQETMVPPGGTAHFTDVATAPSQANTYDEAFDLVLDAQTPGQFAQWFNDVTNWTTTVVAFPTNTPTSTATDIPTATPTDTSTQTPLPPTATPTTVPTSTPSSTPTSTPLSATLAFSPASGVYRQRLTISGAHFEPGELVNVYAVGVTTMPIYSATAAADGSFMVVNTVRQGVNGPHLMAAVGQTSGISATATFTIKAMTTLLHYQGVQGSADVLSGAGFAAHETVTGYWNGPGAPFTVTATANSLGTFGSLAGAPGITFTVPLSPTGTYQVYSVGQRSHAVAHSPFILRPYLSLKPSSGLPGSTTRVTGLGYGAHETITLLYNCGTLSCTSTTVLGTPTTNANGDVSALVTIPASTSAGTHAIGGKGSTSGAFATTIFTVT